MISIPIEEFYNTEWFLERPEHIKQAFYERPPDKEWFLVCYDKGEPIHYYTVSVVGVDDNIDGTITYRIDVDSPYFPRQVFGITKEDLLTEEEAQKLTLKKLY